MTDEIVQPDEEEVEGASEVQEGMDGSERPADPVLEAHGHVWDEGEVACVEIGPTVCLTPIRSADPSKPHDEGYWFCHDVPGAEYRCTGRVLTVNARGGPVWAQTGTLEGGDLTLTPSVLCSAARYGVTEHPECHGWVRDGKWVTA